MRGLLHWDFYLTHWGPLKRFQKRQAGEWTSTHRPPCPGCDVPPPCSAVPCPGSSPPNASEERVHWPPPWQQLLLRRWHHQLIRGDCGWRKGKQDIQSHWGLIGQILGQIQTGHIIVLVDPPVRADLLDTGPFPRTHGQHVPDESRGSRRFPWLVVITLADLLHQSLEIGPIEGHRAVDQRVEQHAQ